MNIELFYDKECPFCKAYANYIKIKQKSNLILINARENKEAIKEFNNLGFNINDGFIIRVDEDKIYQGSDAIIFLNEVSKNRIYFKNNKFFRNFLYPFVKYIRKIVLFCLGKNSKF